MVFGTMGRCRPRTSGLQKRQHHDVATGHHTLANMRVARRARSLLLKTLIAFAIADAFHASTPQRLQQSQHHAPPRAKQATPSAATSDDNISSSSSRNSISSISIAEAALHPIISQLRARIAAAPGPLEDNDEARKHAETTLSELFEVNSDGDLVGGSEQEARLVRALARDTFVVVRAQQQQSSGAREALTKLGAAAEALLGETHSVQEKIAAFGAMRDHERGVVSGYAGGGDYGDDQFLETRGRGGGEIAPAIDAETAPDVLEGRRALSKISSGILRAVVRQSLPEVDPATFLRLVDCGEGGEGGLREVSSTPLRMCRYAGKGGVAFGAHTDTTFFTAIPCASAPGLEILQPSTGRWVRPEAANNCRPGADVMLLAGELLQVFGEGGGYQAAVHRVVRPENMPEPRVSTPLLVRGVAGVPIQDALLPQVVRGILGEGLGEKHTEQARQAETASGGEGGSGGGEGRGGEREREREQLTMTDLWAALQFRGSTSEGDDGGGGGGGGGVVDSDSEGVGGSSPLARSRLCDSGDDIRRTFAPFARDGADGVTILNVEPLLVRLHGFVSKDDCDAIVGQASGGDGLAESTTWGGADAQDESNGLRSSSTTWIADCALPLLEGLTERVSEMSGLPSTFMEKWQVARYKPQGYFKLHTDHVDAFNSLCCGGRLGTLIVYLNDDFEGGHTEFPTIGVSVEPCAGDAIYFHSVQVPVAQDDANDMKPDERSAHAGLPVKGGHKWIATKWIHPLPYPHGKEGPETPQQAE